MPARVEPTPSLPGMSPVVGKPVVARFDGLRWRAAVIRCRRLGPAVDATAGRMKTVDATGPALLATRFTMEQDFYTGRLRNRHGIAALVPDEDRRALVYRVIYEELCCGEVRPESKAAYIEQIDRLRCAGADSVILGCTEITMLIGAEDTELPVFDTTRTLQSRSPGRIFPSEEKGATQFGLCARGCF
jgi:hypothetical protein